MRRKVPLVTLLLLSDKVKPKCAPKVLQWPRCAHVALEVDAVDLVRVIFEIPNLTLLFFTANFLFILIQNMAEKECSNFRTQEDVHCCYREEGHRYDQGEWCAN